MNLRPDQLSAHLEQSLAPLYILFGDEPLLVIEAADAIRAAAKTHGFDEREILIVDRSFRWEELTVAAGNMSLFGGRKLIDLRIPTGKPGRDGGDALQRYVAKLDTNTVTLITLPELDWAARKAVWFKTLMNAGAVLELNAPPRERLPAWISQRLARQEQSAPQDALDFIAEHVEGNLLAAHQEILKLGLLHPSGALTLDAVREAVLSVARYDIDALREAMLEGDPARCVRLVEALRAEGAAPPLVLWALATEIRTLAALATARDAGQSLDAAMKAERVFDKRRRAQLSNALPRLRRGTLQTALLAAARIDRIVKGVADGDVWQEFILLMLRVSRR